MVSISCFDAPGLDANQESLELFRELNKTSLQGEDTIYPDRSYRVPVRLVPLRESLETTLEYIDVKCQPDLIHRYNSRFNPEYTAESVTDLKPGMILYVPV